MITFNTLLRDEGIDPKHVKLARHQDTRYPGRPTPYDLWLAHDGRFERYQQIQKDALFKGARLVASFVVTRLNETLFVGLYENKGVGKAEAGTLDPISQKDVGGENLYDLALSPKLKQYSERLVVEWGPGKRRWVQLANKREKPVIEIRQKADEPFPGFLEFRKRLSDFSALPPNWRTTLSSVKGVYLFVHPETGKQYVGSAQGSDGFWGRWGEYLATGHGGNRRMREIPDADYQVSILEVASSSAGPDVILRMEGHWKQKLQSRKFGLNGN